MWRQDNHEPLEGWKIDGENGAERWTYLTKNEYLILIHQLPAINNYSFTSFASIINLYYFTYLYMFLFIFIVYAHVHIVLLCVYSLRICIYIYLLYKLVFIIPQML